MRSVVIVLFSVMLLGCLSQYKEEQQRAWADGLNKQVWSEVEAMKTFEDITLKSFLASHPCPTTNAVVDKVDGCKGRQLGMIVPSSCGGNLSGENLAWLDDAQAINVKQLDAQCNMQRVATQQVIQSQQAAAASYQQQMQNALFYNDMTRILGYGIYNMMR